MKRSASPLKTSSVNRDERMQGIDMPAPVRDPLTFIADARDTSLIGKNGGRYRDRTCGPYHVKVVLYR